MFEFYNPHTCRVGCHLGPEFGEVKVDPGQYVPTPAQEKAGMEMELWEQHVGPSFLHKTPGNIRRRLRVEYQEAERAEGQRAAAKAAHEDAVEAARAAAVAPGAQGVAAAPQAGVAVVEASDGSGGNDGEGGGTPSAPPAPAAPVSPRVPVPPTGGPRRPEEQLGGSTNKASNDLQSLTDRRCSSNTKEGKKIR